VAAGLRTALVTGASAGIGAATAARLARSGWRVLAGVREEGKAPAACEEVLLDVTDAEQVAAAAARVDALDGLVNNAGIALAAPLELVPVDELRHQLEVNVVAQVAVTQAFVPALRRARGRVVFVGSIAGKSALPFLGSYAASKHALEALADSLRIELGPWGIQVSIVEPGTIKTEIWARSAARADALVGRMGERVAELYGERMAAFRKVAAKRGAGGAPAEAVAAVIEKALTAQRPRTRYLIGRDAHLRAGVERLPDRLRDRLYERLLLR
jgi:NAD(P)-dependent dehydrogenase (short-subunit alcohol dehydrogenase family)